MIGVGVPFDAKCFRVGFCFSNGVCDLSFLEVGSKVLEYNRVV